MYKTRSPTCFAILLHPKSASKCSPCRVASDESALGISHCSILTTLYYSVESSGWPTQGQQLRTSACGMSGGEGGEGGTFGETKNWFSVKLRQCRDSCTTMEGSGWSLEGVRNVNGSYLGRWSTLVRYSDTNTTIAIIASSKGYRGWHNGIPRYINFVCTFFRHPSISMVLPFSWLFSFKPDVCKPSLTLICLRSSSLWPIPSPPLLPCVAPSFSLESTRHDRRVPLFYLYEWPVRFLFRGENEIPSITVWIQSIVL